MAYATPTISDNNSVTEILLEMIRSSLSTSFTGLATATKQDTGNASLATIAAKDFATQTTLAALLALQYAPKGNELKGVTAALTTTTPATLIASPSVNEKIYITSLLVTNSHATVGTVVQILDTITSAVVWSGYAAPAGGGYAITFPVPLKAGSADYSVEAKCLTEGASVIVSAVGFKTT